MFACVCVSSLNCYCYAAERQESQELNFLLPNSPFCQHLNFNFHLLSLSPLSHSILSLIFFDLCTPLSASNLPRRPHYPQLMQPDPLFPCFFFFAFLLSPDPRNTHTHTRTHFLLHYHSLSVPHSDPFSLFPREMMERSDPGDFLVNQWVITCISHQLHTERLHDVSWKLRARSHHVIVLVNNHMVWWYHISSAH